MDFETFMKYREEVQKGRYAEQRAYDRTLVNLAAGGLAFALAFVRTAPTDASQWALWVALASALGFGVSAVACLWSMRVSVRAHDRWLEMLEALYKEGKEFPVNTESLVVERWNSAAWASFILAAACLAAAVAATSI